MSISNFWFHLHYCFVQVFIQRLFHRGILDGQATSSTLFTTNALHHRHWLPGIDDKGVG